MRARRLLGAPVDTWGRVRQSVDWVIVGITAVILVFSLVNLNSAGAGDWTGKVQIQLRWMGLGVLGLAAAAAVDYRLVHRLAYGGYAVGVVLLVATEIWGITAKDATRWLGVEGWRIQPSEFMKVGLIAGLARYLHDLPRRRRRGIQHLIPPLLLVLLPFFFIVRQPDLGTGIMLLLIAVSVLGVTELRLRGILVLMSAGVVAFVLGWSSMAEYQRKRVDVWLDPEAYADHEGYQTIQAMIAVGNGGFFGRGVQDGTQNVLRFLPENVTDFPFAVYAEEWGFVGSAFLILLYMALIVWTLNVASQARDRFGGLLCSGVAAMFFWHVFINVGMVLQLLPVTGITLPFVSAGGSSVFALMLALGLVMSVSRARVMR